MILIVNILHVTFVVQGNILLFRATKIRNVTLAYVILEREKDYFLFWKSDDAETYINQDGYGIISKNDSGISLLEILTHGIQ